MVKYDLKLLINLFGNTKKTDTRSTPVFFNENLFCIAISYKYQVTSRTE